METLRTWPELMECLTTTENQKWPFVEEESDPSMLKLAIFCGIVLGECVKRQAWT